MADISDEGADRFRGGVGCTGGGSMRGYLPLTLARSGLHSLARRESHGSAAPWNPGRGENKGTITDSFAILIRRRQGFAVTHAKSLKKDGAVGVRN